MPTIQVNDVALFYDTVGKGVPLLFIHGLGSSSRDWEKQVPHFTDSYKVITFDVRGHGRSSKPPGPYSIVQFAQDTAGLLEELNSTPAHVIGISMGGMIAFELGVNYPEVVESLTIVNSYPEMRVESFAERLMVWRRYLLLELLGVRRMGVALAANLFPGAEQAELRTLFIERWAENDKRAYRESLRALVGWDVEDRIHDIGCPVLVVASDGDYFPLEEKRAYTAKMKNARLVVIEAARHAVTAEKPEEFNAVLSAFLAEVG